MADAKDINRNVRRLLRAVCGQSAPEFENFWRPSDQQALTGDITVQFGAVRVTAMPAEGIDAQVLTEDQVTPLNVLELVRGVRHLSVSVQVYRGNAYTLIARLPALLRTSFAMDKMRELGLGLIRCGAPRNLTAQVDTNWEERGQIDIEFYLIAAESVSMPTYGTFPMSVDMAVAKPDGSLYPPQTFEVTIP